MTRRFLLLAALFIAPLHAEDKSANPQVEISTSEGVITVELFKDKAPITVENFLKYVDKKFYDGTVFHRVIADFMIQGGGFAQKEDGKHEQKEVMAPIKNEADNEVKNEKGTLAMARTGDPNSATSQFFINVEENAKLNYAGPAKFGYAVFGKVVSGMEVVEKIRTTSTATKVLLARGSDGSTHPASMKDVPVTDVVIKSITLKKDAAKAK